MSETHTLTAGANGQTEHVDITAGLYPIDAAEINIPVKLDNGAIITHVWRKPKLQDHIDRETALERISKAVGRTEFRSERKERQANAAFYDLVILRASGKAEVDGETITEDFDQEHCLKFNFEQKHKVYETAYPDDAFEVINETKNPFASLFEREGTITVKQTIWNTFTLKYVLKIPTPQQRIEFSNSIEITEKFEKKNRRSLITTVNLNKGVKLFNSLLVSIEGGMVQGQAWTDSLKKSFIDNTDDLHKYFVIDTLVDSFNNVRD